MGRLLGVPVPLVVPGDLLDVLWADQVHVINVVDASAMDASGCYVDAVGCFAVVLLDDVGVPGPLQRLPGLGLGEFCAAVREVAI